MGTKRKEYGSVSNAKKKLNAAASHRACYVKNGEAPLQAALHARQQQAIAAGGIVAAEAIRDRAVRQRDEGNARTAKRTCPATPHWGYFDLSELLWRESEAAAKTAKDDRCKSQAALHASEAAAPCRGGRAACVGFPPEELG